MNNNFLKQIKNLEKKYDDIFLKDTSSKTDKSSWNVELYFKAHAIEDKINSLLL